MNQAGALGGIEQVVSAIPGAVYTLDLDAAAWVTNGIGGTLGYELFDPVSSAILASGLFTDNVGGTWVPRSLQATAISSQIGVRIQALASTEAAIGLDNVRLTQVNQATIPTLSEWAQIGMAALLVGGGLLAIRKKGQLTILSK